MNALCADIDGPHVSVVYRGGPITDLPTLLGPNTVALAGDALEFYSVLDGASNPYPWERWRGVRPSGPRAPGLVRCEAL